MEFNETFLKDYNSTMRPNDMFLALDFNFSKDQFFVTGGGIGNSDKAQQLQQNLSLKSPIDANTDVIATGRTIDVLSVNTAGQDSNSENRNFVKNKSMTKCKSAAGGLRNVLIDDNQNYKIGTASTQRTADDNLMVCQPALTTCNTLTKRDFGKTKALIRTNTSDGRNSALKKTGSTTINQNQKENANSHLSYIQKYHQSNPSINMLRNGKICTSYSQRDSFISKTFLGKHEKPNFTLSNKINAKDCHEEWLDKRMKMNTIGRHMDVTYVTLNPAEDDQDDFIITNNNPNYVNNDDLSEFGIEKSIRPGGTGLLINYNDDYGSIKPLVKPHHMLVLNKRKSRRAETAKVSNFFTQNTKTEADHKRK